MRRPPERNHGFAMGGRRIGAPTRVSADAMNGVPTTALYNS